MNVSTKVFTVEITVQEEGDSTEARASMQFGDERLGGWGRARRNPADPDRPRLGDELSMARALSDLAHHMLDQVADRIEAAEGSPAQIHL